MTLRTWSNLEGFLCVVLIFGRFVVLYQTWGQDVGFDVHAHKWTVDTLSIFKILAWENQSYLAYHPPLAFWFAAVLRDLLHIPTGQAVQLLAWIACLGAFFWMRETLKALGVLNSPAAIAFLYLSSSIPVLIFLSHSINMESLLLAEGSAALFFSIILSQAGHGLDKTMKGSILGLALSVTCALLTKASGLIVLTIPVLVLVFMCKGRWSWTVARPFALSMALALVLAFPYFVARRSLNVPIWPIREPCLSDPKEVVAFRQRDADPARFVVNLFGGSQAVSEDIRKRDEKSVRLIETWRDLWVKAEWPLGGDTGVKFEIEKFYFYAMPFFCLLGLILFGVNFKGDTLWRRLGLFSLALTVLQIGALMVFAYNLPTAWCYPIKGIYVPMVTWSVAFLLSCLTLSGRGSAYSFAICVFVVVPFMVLNHLMVIY